jgi:HlyD family secretion protein
MNEATMTTPRETTPPARARGKHPERRRLWPYLGGLLVLGLGAVLLFAGFRRGEELRHFTAEVQQGDIRDTVEATGTANAVINVQVGSQVSGTIAQLNADFNSHVHRGEVVALIDSKLFVGALEQANADLESAEANVQAADAGLASAHAHFIQTKADYERAAVLSEKKLVAPSDLDAAKANYDSARAAVDGAAASLRQAKAMAALKRAAVAVARTNLDYTVIRSPIDGVVVARSVDVGQTVAASLQAPTIFTIAEDLGKMLVYAKVDESDVGRIKKRQPVTFKVDAYPKEQFKGFVQEIRMNPTMIQNVVTYDTVIEFANPDQKIFPGMTAYVTIPVATAENVVKVPNAALRYKPVLPPEVVRGLYAKFGIDEKPAAHGESGVVWKLTAGGALQPIRLALGITDHTFTEVTSGAVQRGDELVTSSVLSKTLPPGSQGIRR